uniref:NR LBD domain-containing protein n=1 Tax=Strongyloides venezuelensis TaxID=75913 RepID=A0A0K0FPF9_STRVS
MSADIVAKNDFLMMKSFRHSYGCSLCLTECSYFSKRPVYPSAKECVFRTRDLIVDDVNYVFRNIDLTDIGSLLNTNLTLETIEFIKSVLFKWHDNRTQVISKIHYSKIKSHDITHLAYVAKYHGLINCFSAFSGEASLHDLHSLLSSLSMENVLTQITKRLDEKWLIFEKPKFSISDIQERLKIIIMEITIYFRKVSLTLNYQNMSEIILRMKYVFLRTPFTCLFYLKEK